jgi:hypothetical protein
MDLSVFYGIMAGLSFTLLGLWWVASQGRKAWLSDRGGRAMAYVVSLHFVLPGAMSLLSLVAPDLPAMWRVTFTTAGALGVLGTVLIIRSVRRHAASEIGLVQLLQWVALPLYAAVTAVAADPDLVGFIGLAPIQVEAILLVILVLLGTQSAWLVTFATDD